MFTDPSKPKSAQFADLARSMGHTVREVSPPKPASPRITNMLDRVNDLIADTNQEIAKLTTYHPDRPALMQARLALQQAQRELTSL